MFLSFQTEHSRKIKKIWNKALCVTYKQKEVNESKLRENER